MPPCALTRLQSFQKFLEDNADDASMMMDATETIKGMLPAKMDFDMASSVSATVKAMPLAQDAKKSIMAAVRSSCMPKGATSSKSGRTHGQQYENIMNYFSKEFWRVAPRLSPDQRFNYIVDVAIKLGARNLSEFSKSLIMCLCNAEEINDMDGQELYLLYKSYNQMILKRFKNLPEPKVYVHELPLDPQSLPKELHWLFQGGLPIRCPESHLQQFISMAHRVPVRGGAAKFSHIASAAIVSKPITSTPAVDSSPRLRLFSTTGRHLALPESSPQSLLPATRRGLALQSLALQNSPQRTQKPAGARLHHDLISFFFVPSLFTHEVQ